VDGYREILAWEKEQNISFSHIFAASGTGSTQCGLVSGKLLEQGTEQIIGLSISSREYDRAIRIMESGISDYFAKNHLVLPEGWESELHLEMGYRQGGYGQYDERILQVIREEFCRNGLPLDPTYTGKAFWGMKQYIEEHQLQDCDVLFIHTGGTPLFYDCILNDTDGGKK
jgi:D-cysteine desulfhydrase